MNFDKPPVAKKQESNLNSGEIILNAAEAPALEAEYELRLGYILTEAEKITPEDIATSREKIREGKEKAKDENELEWLQNLEVAINAILSIKTLTDKQKVIEQLAKTKIYELSKLIHGPYGFYCTDHLVNAIFNLNEATYALARFKFPEEVKSQTQYQEDLEKDKLAKQREFLMKKNVT